MTERHIIKLPKRTITVEITEEPSRVVVKLRTDKYQDLGDGVELQKWMLPILEKYDSDPRPLVFAYPLTGQTATVFGDANHSVVLVQPVKANN